MRHIDFNLKDTVNLIRCKVDVIGSWRVVEAHGPKSGAPELLPDGQGQKTSWAPSARANTHARKHTSTHAETPTGTSLCPTETPSLVVFPCRIGPPALISKNVIKPLTAWGSEYRYRYQHVILNGFPAEQMTGCSGGTVPPQPHDRHLLVQLCPVLFQEDSFAGFFFFLQL